MNWFRVNEQGKFIWPGFGENLRVIRWIIDRCQDQGETMKTPIGYLPTPEALRSEDLGISPEGWRTLLGINRSGRLEAARRQTEFFEKFGARLPTALRNEQASLITRLKERKDAPLGLAATA